MSRDIKTPKVLYQNPKNDNERRLNKTYREIGEAIDFSNSFVYGSIFVIGVVFVAEICAIIYMSYWCHN